MNITKGYISNTNTRICVLDGTICTSINQFYDTITFQLQIPDYFGRNLDALEEILYDLEWVEEDFVQFILLNEGQFLQNEPDLKPIVLDILNSEDHTRIKFESVKY